MHGTTVLEDFRTTGIAGWLIVLATFALVPAGLICTVTRVPRVVAVCLLAASLVVPVACGVVGLFSGRHAAHQVLASLKAPTPADEACGEREARTCLVIGLGSALLCYAVALPALARSRDPSDAGDEPADARRPVPR